MKQLMTALFMFFVFFGAVSYADPPTATANKPADISLYEQPDAKSKVIGTIAPGVAIIPIFSQDHWLKVGNPANGQVGWINNEALPAQEQVFIKTIKDLKSNAPANDYQVTQYSGTTQIDEQQMKELVKNLQNRQGELQQMFNQMLNQSVVNFNALLRQLNQEAAQPLTTPAQQPAVKSPETTPQVTLPTSDTTTTSPQTS